MSRFSSVKIRSVDQLLKDGDASIRSKIIVTKSEFYTSKTPVCAADDLIYPNPQFQSQFIAPKTIQAPSQYLLFLQNCYVLPNAAIVTSDGNIIEESCFPYTTELRIAQFFAPWVYRCGKDLNARVDDAKEISSPLFYLREHGEMGFFHWMHSVLPRMQHFMSNGFNRKFSILSRREARFQRESLGFCKFLGLNFIDPDEQNPMFVRELIFPAPLVQQGDFWLRPPSVCRFYDQFFSAVPDGPKRLYIARSDALIRRIKNENALLDFLAQFGFESIELGRLPFSQQVALLRSAEMVVSAHGAGLSHIAHMPEFSTVLEILHPQRFWPTYRALAARRGATYAALIGTDPNSGSHDDTSDFDIDLKKLDEVLIKLGKNSCSVK
jgi:hypothetical protein